MIMADAQKPDRQDEQQQEEEEENDDERQQKEQDKEESPQSPPSKVARVSSDESSAAAELGAVTTAVASPLVLGLGLGVGTAAALVGEEGKPPGFTFMQMQEFHHQSLIFKHMVAGVPVPIHLILPIWKSVAASYGPHHYPSFVGLGSLCSDFRNSMEPEPGRCRRTDGKKWRCSRDVVPDQKYCDRHMHRGRNRSRKPVEAAAVGTSSSVAPPTSTTTTTTTLSITIADDDGPTNNNNNNKSSLSSNFNKNSGSSNDVSAARIIGSSPTTVLSSSTACKTAATS